MYSLLFHNKWMAVLWAGMTLLGIYISTPREGGKAPIAALIGPTTPVDSPEFAMARAKAQEEKARQAKLDAFNAGEDERGQVQLVDSYSEEM